jgi:hypothetical protein
MCCEFDNTITIIIIITIKLSMEIMYYIVKHLSLFYSDCYFRVYFNKIFQILTAQQQQFVNCM